MDAIAQEVGAAGGDAVPQDDPHVDVAHHNIDLPHITKLVFMRTVVAYLTSILIILLWFFASYLLSNIFWSHATLPPDENATTFFDVTELSPKQQRLVSWAGVLPNIIFAVLFLYIGMASDKINAYTLSVLGNLVTLIAAIVFAFAKGPNAICSARILMAFGESVVLPQGLRFVSYNFHDSPWARLISMWLYGIANIELNVAAAIIASILEKDTRTGFFICLGAITLSFLLLVSYLPVSGSPYNLKDLFTTFLEPMVAEGEKQRVIRDKLAREGVRLEDEEIRYLKYEDDHQNIVLKYYAAGIWDRLDFRKFDYGSVVLAGISLGFLALSFGPIAFAGASLSDHAQYMPWAFHRLAVWFFVGTLFMVLCSLSIVRWHKAPRLSETNVHIPRANSILEVGQAGPLRFDHIFSYRSTPFFPDDLFNRSAENQVPLRGLARQDEQNYPRRKSILKSVTCALAALLAELIGFLTSIGLFITLSKEVGGGSVHLLWAVFASPTLFLLTSILAHLGKSKDLFKTFHTISTCPEAYLTSANVAAAIMSLIITQLDTESVRPVLLVIAIIFYTVNVMATFSYLVHTISGELQSLIGLSTGALDYIIDLSLILALALGRTVSSAVQRSSLHPSVSIVADIGVIEQAQRCFGLVMVLQVIAAVITFTSVRDPSFVENAHNRQNGGQNPPDPENPRNQEDQQARRDQQGNNQQDHLEEQYGGQQDNQDQAGAEEDRDPFVDAAVVGHQEE